MNILLAQLRQKRLDQSGINMVDLMMWLVIAALLLAAALQGIGFYQRAAYFYDMQTEVNGVAANAHAAASVNGGYMDDAVLSNVVADNNSKHSTDSIVVTYGSIMATASGPASENGTNFELASAVTATPSDTVYYLKASSTLVVDKYVVYFFKGTPTFMQGVSIVSKSGIDGGGTEPAIVPGGGATPAPTATPTPTPSVTPTASPTPTATPTGPSIVSAADIVAYDASGELWNFGPVASDMTARKSISPAGATIPDDFYVTDWNSDGVQDLVLKMTNGDFIWRKGLPTGGFTDTTIGSGFNLFEITVGKWKKTDTYPSVIAKEISTGNLFNYPNPSGTGMITRVPLGTGWSPYTPLNLADWDKDGNMDVFARNRTTNDLLTYRTNGAGAFISETRPSNAGWTFNSLHTVSGRGGPGTVGLLGRYPSGDLYYYPINNGAFGTPTLVSGGWSSYKIAGN